MKNVLKKFTDTNIRFNCRFSYAAVLEPKATPNGDMKYSVSLLIPKSDTATLQAIREAIEAAKEIGKGKCWGGKIPPAATLKLPLRDGDEERPDDEAYAGHMFINVSSKRKPGVKVLDAGVIADALDETDFYSGCYGAAEVNFYPYAEGGSKGVTAGLNNVIKLEDGEKMAGGMSADEAFGDIC